MPVMPLVEVVGSALNVPPEQIAATRVKVGVVGVLMVMLNEELPAGLQPVAATVYVAVWVPTELAATLISPVVVLIDKPAEPDITPPLVKPAAGVGNIFPPV